MFKYNLFIAIRTNNAKAIIFYTVNFIFGIGDCVLTMRVSGDDGTFFGCFVFGWADDLGHDHSSLNK